MTRRLAAIAALLLLALPAPRSIAAPLSLPPSTRTTLGNGLVVVVVPSSRLPLVHFRLVARAGAAYDPAGREGLSSLTADLLTQGAGPRDARAIADDIGFVGGMLAAGSDAERLVVTCEVLKKDFATGLELFRDVVAAPAFADSEFVRQKAEALGAIASALDDPEEVADRAVLPWLVKDGPLGHPALGWDASVRAITREDVADFHRRLVTPGNSVLVVTGDVDPKNALQAIEDAFKKWKTGEKPAPIPYPPLLRNGGRAVRIVSWPGASQAQIRLACPGVARNHPDYYPIRVANAILGEGFASRLVKEIRVERGFTYSIDSDFTMYRNAGMFGVSTFTRTATLRGCVDATLAAVRRLIDQGPTEEELDRARRYLTGQFPLGLQAPGELAARVADIEFYSLDPRFLETFDERIGAVTMTDCRRALKSYFCVDDLKLLVVANPDSVKATLAGLGAIDVVQPR